MLPLYKNILIPTDFSENSNLAFRHAVMLARQNNAQIYLLHVIPPLDQSMKNYLSTYMDQKIVDEMEQNKMQSHQEDLKKELQNFTQTELGDFPEDLKRFVCITVEVGQPVAKILEVAVEKDIDVIVMGTHGRGIIEHAFLGSVAEKVLRKAHCPVFVVPLKP